MKAGKKKLIMLAAAFATVMPVAAIDFKTEKVGSYTWTYSTNPSWTTADIYATGLFDSPTTAVSPKPTGTVTIPSVLGGKTVNWIGERSMSYCSGMTGVTIPDCVTHIGDFAFQECSGLTSVTIPDSVTSLGRYAFEGCRGLTSARIGNGVESIQAYTFKGCAKLSNVTIPGSVTSIGYEAFASCSNLTSVTIPDSVTYIGNRAFRNSSGLTSVSVGSGVTSIGDEAFAGCKLTTVLFRGNAPDIASFSGWNPACVVKVFPNSTGWGVPIPGTWNGLRIEYVEGYTVTYKPGAYASGSDYSATETKGVPLTLRGGTYSRVGYSQTGWTTSDGGAKAYDLGALYTANANGTLYPFWSANMYSLTLNANGGSVSGQPSISAQVVYGKNTNQAAANRTVTYAGYMLLGWFDTPAASGGNVVFDAQGHAVNGMYWDGSYSPGSSSATWKFAGAVTAYARWAQDPGKYTVTLDANGGNVSGQTAVSFQVEKGKNTCQAGAKRTVTHPNGKTLAGWYDAISGGNMVFSKEGYAVDGKYWSGSYSPSVSSAKWKYVGSVTAYARWTEPAKYTVTLKANGGTFAGGAATASFQVESGKNTCQAGAKRTVTHPNGKTLAGWYDLEGIMIFDANGYAVSGKYWNGSYSPGVSSATWKYAGNVEVYARWRDSARYTVTFYGGGKTLGTATVETGKNTNQAAASVHKPTRAGYTLSGWYDANDNIMFDAQGRAVNGKYWNGSYVKGTSSATWKFAGNVTAYAHWTSASVKTVTLNANGGTFADGATVVRFQVEIGKNTCQAGAKRAVTAPSGKTLVGWYDQDNNMVFDAMGYATDGKYWNGSYWPKESSATWKYAGDVTVFARWSNISNAATRKSSRGVNARLDDELFSPGEFFGEFVDGGGVFMLTLDAGLATACLAMWTDDGDTISECEAEVVDGTLLLTTEEGEIYRMVWDGGSLVATRIE